MMNPLVQLMNPIPETKTLTSLLGASGAATYYMLKPLVGEEEHAAESVWEIQLAILVASQNLSGLRV